MHQLLPFICGMAVFASCSTQYQFGTIKSLNTSQNDNYEFVADNDTLSIRYSFGGGGAPVVMIIENKLDLPVYIDWKQSALIMNGKTITYAPSDIPITGDISLSGTHVNRVDSYASGSVNAVATVQPGMDFLPPHTFLEKRPFLLPIFLAELPDSLSRRVTLADGRQTKFKAASYTDSTSPFRFRNYLTMAVGEVTTKPIRMEHSFYVSDLISAKVDAATFGFNLYNRADKYAVSVVHSTGAGEAVGGLFIGAVLVAAAAMASQKTTIGE